MVIRYYKYKETHRSVGGQRQKYCTECNKWKARSEFGIDRYKRDGLKMRCKDCDKTYNAILRKKYKKGKNIRTNLKFEQRHRIIDGLKEKLCSKCGRWKQESKFYKSSSHKDELSTWCKKCSHKPGKNKIRTNLTFEQRHRIIDGIREKLCSKCDEWKNEKEFNKSSSTQDGLTQWCRRCARKSKGNRGRINIKFEQRHRIIDGVREKLCSKCGKWKNENEFYKCGSRKDGLSCLCSKCSYIPVEKAKKASFPP